MLAEVNILAYRVKKDLNMLAKESILFYILVKEICELRGEKKEF